MEKDEPIVNLLCWWAVSGVRYGEHRAMAVAKLLERRNALVLAGGSDSPDSEDKDSASSLPPGLPVFQSLLMKFLDQDAPVFGKYLIYFMTCESIASRKYPVAFNSKDNNLLLRMCTVSLLSFFFVWTILRWIKPNNGLFHHLSRFYVRPVVCICVLRLQCLSCIEPCGSIYSVFK